MVVASCERSGSSSVVSVNEVVGAGSRSSSRRAVSEGADGGRFGTASLTRVTGCASMEEEGLLSRTDGGSAMTEEGLTASEAAKSTKGTPQLPQKLLTLGLTVPQRGQRMKIDGIP